jgi:hypothetical protein
LKAPDDSFQSIFDLTLDDVKVADGTDEHDFFSLALSPIWLNSFNLNVGKNVGHTPDSDDDDWPSLRNRKKVCSGSGSGTEETNPGKDYSSRVSRVCSFQKSFSTEVNVFYLVKLAIFNQNCDP